MGRIVDLHGRNGLSEHRIEVEGIPMRWLEAGTAAADSDAGHPGRGTTAGRPTDPHRRAARTPVVMVHGVPTSAELWRRVLPAVDGPRPMAWEMVGYGKSIPAGRGRDIAVARQAEYLTAWLRALDIQRAVLVGHDLGGGVVQNVAVREPERCAGLVLTNAIAYDSWPVRPMKVARALSGLVRRVPDALMARIFVAVISRMHRPRELGLQSARIHWSHYAHHDGAAAFARQARSLDVQDTLAVADRLGEIRVPTRIVWGDDDPFQPISWGRKLAADLHAPLRPMSGARHFTPEDRPGPVAAAINEVVQEAGPPSHGDAGNSGDAGNAGLS